MAHIKVDGVRNISLTIGIVQYLRNVRAQLFEMVCVRECACVCTTVICPRKLQGTMHVLFLLCETEIQLIDLYIYMKDQNN